MTIATEITSGSSSRSATFTLAAGAVMVIFANRDLAAAENVSAERSYDGGTNYRPIPGGVLDSNHNEARIYGPVTAGRLTITDTAAATVVYSDT